MNEVRQIVYVSTAVPKLSPLQLDGLLKQAQKNNGKRDVTGLLVYADGSIMQTIEGSPEAISDLVEIISQDPRHRDFKVIADFVSDERTFPNWRMAFNHEPHPEKLDACVELLRAGDELKRDLSGKGVIGKVMKNFIERLR
jgi:hypothetical protein